MRYIDVLCWGMEHIAQNHGFEAATHSIDDGDVCIFGGCNVPTLQDVIFLCEDLKIEKDCIESSDFGIDVFITEEWYEGYAQEEYKPTGHEFWKRYDSIIGM